MPSTGIIPSPTPLDPLPIPSFDAAAAAGQPGAGQQAEQPPSARALGSMPKGGGIAMIADKFLRGWMAGKYMKEQKEQKKAASEIGSLRAAVDITGQAYHSMLQQGVDEKDPKVQQARGALSAAWQAYLDKAQRYAVPEDVKTKGGLGQKVKSGLKSRFTAQSPQLFSQAALDSLRKADPATLFGQSKEEQVRGMKVTQEEQVIKDKNRWRELSQKTDLTQQERGEMEALERDPALFPSAKTRSEQMKDQLLNDVFNGQSKTWTPERKQLAQQLGIMRPDVTNVQMREIRGPNGKPQTQLVAIGPEGKLVSTQTLPGNAYVPPDHYQTAAQVLNSQFSTMKQLYTQAHPGATPEQAGQFALQWMSGAKSNGGDWGATESQMRLLNTAISDVVGEAKKMGMPEADSFQNLYTRSQDTGNYVYNSFAADPKVIEHWFRADEKVLPFGGTDVKVMPGVEAKFRGLLKTSLIRHNKGMTEQQAEGLLPPPVFRAAQQGGGPPADVQTRASGQGAGSYKVKDPKTGQYLYGGQAVDYDAAKAQQVRGAGFQLEPQE